MNEKDTRQRLLDKAYAENTGGLVAYIDESYQAPSFGFPTTPFYVATAYLIPVSDLDLIRSDLPHVTESTYWHSTQSHQTADGQERIRNLIKYISEGSETIIVAVKNPIPPDDPDGERARRECLTELLSALSTGQFCEPVVLAILEERKLGAQRNADARTVTLARNSGRIARNMRALTTSPSVERLLWLPDVVSFALYRQNAGHHDDYAKPLARHVRIITVPSTA